jgi:Tol biopolymer transport system component
MTDPSQRLSAALADRYRIERELGAGGMATVYLAEDLRHHRQVAIKVLRPDLAATLGPDRFLREIEVAAKLHHPHILPLYDSGEADGFLFYVMPYESGHSLRERLVKETELPVPEVVRLLRDVADALTHAHEHGLVHRDIKPENVLLSGRHAMVTDFGVAKAVSDATGRQKLTTIGVALGTPAYMAPEQAAADPHIDQRADIYALGVVGYELLTGRPPFTGLTPQAILAAQVTQEPTPITELRPTVPAELAALVMRCLAKKPADRFQTAAELLPILELLATPSGGTTPFGTTPVRLERPALRRPLVMAGAVVVLLLLVGAVWAALRPRPLSLRVANVRQITHENAVDLFPAISPDGREVAYQSGFPGNTDILVRDLAGGRPLNLTEGWPGVQVMPRWMPDGARLVFWNGTPTSDHSVGQWQVPRRGGQAVAADSADRVAVEARAVLTVEGDSVTLVSPTGKRSRFRILSGAVNASRAWRKDGEAVAVVVGAGDYYGSRSWGNIAPSTIWVTVAGHLPVLVTDTTSLNVSPAWLPDGTLLFVSNRDGARDIYAQRLDGAGRPRGQPLRLTTGLEAYSVSASADGRTLAYDRFILRRNIYTLPIPKSGTVALSQARPITSGNQIIESLSLSRDGKWLAFDSNLEGNQDIYVMPASGGEARRVTRGPGDNFGPGFSPDGKQIAFHSTRNATRDIYIISADGTGEQRLTSDSEQSTHPSFSPDGLSLAYGTYGRSLLLLRRPSLTGPWGKPEPLPARSGYAPTWSPDGSSLTYEDWSDSAGIGLLRLGGTPRLLVPAGVDGLLRTFRPGWTRDGSHIYFRGQSTGGAEGVYEVASSGGTPRLVVAFDDPSRPVFTGGPVTSGDGMFYFAVGEIESDIYVMDLLPQ